jgi:hypothetical protein
MDPQERRERGVGDEDPTQWYRSLAIRKRLMVAALHFMALFVVLYGDVRSRWRLGGSPGGNRRVIATR